jgi:hypothetical protein
MAARFFEFVARDDYDRAAVQPVRSTDDGKFRKVNNLVTPMRLNWLAYYFRNWGYENKYVNFDFDDEDHDDDNNYSNNNNKNIVRILLGVRRWTVSSMLCNSIF